MKLMFQTTNQNRYLIGFLKRFMRFHGNVVKAINQPIKMVVLGIVDPIVLSTLQQLMGSFEIGIHPNYGHLIEKMMIKVTGFWGTLFSDKPV
jgi:hypothetical protein